jgi:hypothetical protein
VKIWGENWIPMPVTYKIQSPPREMDITSKVYQLIDWDRKWWDNEKLVNMFSEEEIAAIKKIPISHTDQPDCQIWRCTSSGIFSMKSAYHLAKELEERKTPECSNQVKDSPSVEDTLVLTNPKCGKKFLLESLQKSVANER